MQQMAKLAWNRGMVGNSQEHTHGTYFLGKDIWDLSRLAEAEEHAEIFIGVRYFAGAVLGFPAVIRQGFIGEDNAMTEIAFKIGKQHVAQTGVAIAAERKPVDDDGSHAMMDDLQLQVGWTSEDLDGIGFDERKRIDGERIAA